MQSEQGSKSDTHEEDENKNERKSDEELMKEKLEELRKRDFRNQGTLVTEMEVIRRIEGW